MSQDDGVSFLRKSRYIRIETFSWSAMSIENNMSVSVQI